MLNRRAFLLGSLSTALAMPLAADAQQAQRLPRIGYLHNVPAASPNRGLENFREELRVLGYLEGQNVELEIRSAAGPRERYPDAVVELIRAGVDIIVTGTGLLALAAKGATQTIPVVMASSGDAVTMGLVASLARPGGNVTGITLISPEVSQKRLEVLRDMLPNLTRVGVLWCGPARPVGKQEWKETQAAAAHLKIQLFSLQVSGPEELDEAFALAVKRNVEAVVMFDCSPLHPSGATTVQLSTTNRLPGMYPFRLYPESFGGLISYGPDLLAGYRRAAHFVDRILRGANPADLPVEQPTKFDLVINLKTAKALGLTIPPSLLLRADQVIE